jgi:hypothetical protein
MGQRGLDDSPPSARTSSLHLTQAIGQQPQRAIEPDAGVDALHGTGVLATAIDTAGPQATLDKVFLDTIKHAPQIGAVVVSSTGQLRSLRS